MRLLSGKRVRACCALAIQVSSPRSRRKIASANRMSARLASAGGMPVSGSI